MFEDEILHSYQNVLVERARKFALKSHGQQKYGNLPYSTHLDAVAKLTKNYDKTAQMIAYLHDVVEDTPTTVQEIKEIFGPLVSECVQILTDEPGKNRKERKEKTYAKMAQVKSEHKLALIVKAADRLANLRCCTKNKNERLLATYKEEQAAFRKAVYRKGLCDEFWQEIEELIAL